LERKGDTPSSDDADIAPAAAGTVQPPNDPDARGSEFSVSRGGMHQESRDHTKHNNSGQTGHKPQKHPPDEEKR